MIHLLMEAKKGSLQHEAYNETNTEFASVEESNIGKSDIKIRMIMSLIIYCLNRYFH